MPTRIEIELTSTSNDGSWTWRAAGAREPRGVVDGSLLPAGAGVGDQLRAEVEQDIEGIHVLSVLPPKGKPARSDVIELLPSSDSFEPVIQQRAHRDRDEGRGDRRGPRRDRADRGDRGDRGDRRPGARRDGEGPARGPRPDRRDSGGPRREGGERREGADRPEGGRREGGDRRNRPYFAPPPEIPQRPKPKRLRPGKEHRAEVLAAMPEEQRPIAELALQGIPAVRQRLREDNARLKAEGKPEMPEAAVLKMAEELLPGLRVADWLDRASAAKRQLTHLDLRDLRSVVVAADDPLVAREEATRALAAELKQALVTKQEEELALWLGDVEAALDVGRVVRALRLSSQPPKAGVPFPAALAQRLGEAATASLQPTDASERWVAVLEAAAFSPIRSHVTPTAAADQPNDELLATVKRLGPLLPQVAAVFGVEVPDKAHVPKPLRPNLRKPAGKDAPKGPGGGARARGPKPGDPDAPGRRPKPIPPPTASADAGASAPEAEPTSAEAEPAEPAESPGAEPTATEPPATSPGRDADPGPTAPPPDPSLPDAEPASPEASSPPQPEPPSIETPEQPSTDADPPAAEPPAAESPTTSDAAPPETPTEPVELAAVSHDEAAVEQANAGDEGSPTVDEPSYDPDDAPGET